MGVANERRQIPPALALLAFALAVPAAHAETFTVTAGPNSGTRGLFGSLTFASDGSSGAIPEPGTWTLMVTGLGLAGVLMRRRGLQRGASPAIVVR